MTEVPPTQDPPAPLPTGISTITIEEEMKSSYLDYAMSVIVSRALPDVRDGLKPVHRRILYAMKENGYDWNRPFRKSARVVGDVMGKYHPHGDTAIYDAMVRMAQDFSMRLTLIDGQGNFGSMDGDPAAAMRYTEARLTQAAHELLADIDKDTVDFQDNYDSTSREPSVLPAQFPNLLVNGAGGIAVGMATNIPTHNLGEVIDACCLLLDDPDATIERLMECIPGPDFPTGGIIYGGTGIRSAYHTGRGSVIMRGRTEIEDMGRDRSAIIVTEVPYQVNKARMIEQIAEAVRDKRIEGISGLRDESDRHGVRVVIELKREAMAEVVLNQLYRFSPLQTSFGVNMLALNAGRPEMLNLKHILEAFIAFREEVITRRTVHELGKARERAHVLVGLAIAVANLDDVIALIRAAKDPQVAREQLVATPWPAGDVAPLIELIAEPGRTVVDGHYHLSEAQARAILELRLHRLTGLERDKIADELRQVCAQITEYLEILVSREKLRGILRGELVRVRELFATPRRTELVENDAEVDVEDLIQREDMVVTVSHNGYIKRVPLSAYRAQRRGGKGRAGMSIREEDFVSRLFVANTHTPVLFFSSRGQVYKEKVYRLPQGTPQARGKALVNLLPLEEGETITTLMPLPEDESTWEGLKVLFATSQGYVRPISLSEYKNIYSRGLIAIKLLEGDKLVGVQVFSEGEDALIATRNGKCIRFALDDLRLYGSRNTVGVRGIRLVGDDEVISLSLLRHVDFSVEERDAYLRRRRAERADAEESGDNGTGNGGAELDDARFAAMSEAEQFILTATARGFGKRTSAYEYRIANRGGQGIGNIDLGRNGKKNAVVGSFPVASEDQIMLVTDAGKLIRTMVEHIRIAGRSTRGVTLFRVADDEQVVSVAHLAEPEDAGMDGADEIAEEGLADGPETVEGLGEEPGEGTGDA